jgi:hypothetical protein
MSGAQAEADFDESVFDAPSGEGGEGEATQPPVDAKPESEPKADPDPPPSDPKAKIEETARKAGWSGKDDWKGDPADWLEAPEFILKAVGDVLPSMRKSLEKANEEIAGLKKSVKASIQHLSKARQEGYEQRGRELQADLEARASVGDVAGVAAVTKDIVALEKEVSAAPVEEDAAPDEPPEFAAWREENPWWGKDKPLTAAAVALGQEVFAEGYSGKAQIKEVDRRLREQFPGKFAPPENPNRKLAPAVEGLGSGRRAAGKSFSDMPKEHQEMWAEMNRLHPMAKENYAKEYFAGEQR